MVNYPDRGEDGERRGEGGLVPDKTRTRNTKPSTRERVHEMITQLKVAGEDFQPNLSILAFTIQPDSDRDWTFISR